MITPSKTFLTTSLFAVMATGAFAESGIPYGIEALTSYRSEYIYRGFELSNDTIDFQLSSRISLENDYSINTASWYNSALDDGDFNEFGFYADIRKDIGDMTYSLGATYRDYDDTFFNDGFDIFGSATWHVNKCVDLGASVSYDTGADGWYGELFSSYYYRINDSSFLTLRGGVSAVDDYYGREGFNDVFAKLAYTYDINQTVSVSPYIATSILLDDDELGNDSFFGGVYFAVSF